MGTVDVETGGDFVLEMGAAINEQMTFIEDNDADVTRSHIKNDNNDIKEEGCIIYNKSRCKSPHHELINSEDTKLWLILGINH